MRAGGRYRCVWRNAEGVEMGTGGTYREIVRPERLVRTERFDQDWTGGETLCTARADRALQHHASPGRRAGERHGKGIAHSYNRMEVLLQEQAA
ncbi:hypothetical protein CJO92_16975 (plasmid) [Ralstonia solanacearum]|uniref:Activator of Hsp90 ATPase homologue 1/2-like C-terminal domain-containing protein n=1 Tax=Ralstonia solanacearum TaxID=305 RepID=A0AAD0S9R3_RALSL|nr:hypothetical protein CJO77_16970 [Ralstonia solanacearum]AXW54448.1 hypothetical protein CJO92_16975 [Ralstonia solanacearum]